MRIGSQLHALELENSHESLGHTLNFIDVFGFQRQIDLPRFVG